MHFFFFFFYLAYKVIICARISKRWSRYIQCVLRQQLKHKKTCKLFILSGTFSSGGALSCNCSFSVLQMHFSPFTSSRCVFNKNYISHNIQTWPQAHLTFDCCMCEMIKHMGRKRILAFFLHNNDTGLKVMTVGPVAKISRVQPLYS